jgi:hypothetical protein
VHNATLLVAIREAVDGRDWVYAERTIEHFSEFVDDPRLAAARADFLARKRKAQEEILLVEAENLPGTDVRRNRAVYAKLASLRPDNDEYARRLRLYNQRLAEENAAAVEGYFRNRSRTRADHGAALALLREALEIAPAEPRYRALLDRLRRDALLFPEGDGRLETAVEDEGVRDGVRTFYLWAFNVGRDGLRLGPERIELATVTNATLRPAQAPDFDVTLSPGRSVRGRVSFATSAAPEALTVRYDDGAVTRRFPQSDE